MKLVFGDIVVVDGDQIGVVVKSWGISSNGSQATVEVYVRSYNSIRMYPIDEVERYQVRHKYLDENDLEWQHIAEQEP